MISILQKIPKPSNPVYCFATIHQTKYSSQQLQYYSSLRIHKEKSFLSILNNLTINYCLKYDWIVDNGPKLFNVLYTLCGRRIGNIIVNNTIGKVFTAGENLETVEHYLSCSQSQVSYIIDYSSEALEGLDDCEKFYDENSSIFRQTVLGCARKPEKKNMTAIKVSSLINMDLLKKINKAKQNIIDIYAKLSDDKKHITIKQLLEFLKKEGITLNQNDQHQLIKNILKLNSEETEIDFITWKYRMQPIFMFDLKLNQHPIIKYFNKLNDNELFLFEQFIERIRYFMEPAVQNSVGVMVDAEQTYLQQAIDSFSEQMEQHYNQNQVIVFNTFQNYLKSTKERVDYELEKSHKFQIPIALKMVRGAYLVEETKLANEEGRENPINDGYEATTKMIERNLEKIIQNIDRSPTHLFVASHNEETVEYVKEIMARNQVSSQGNVVFAQLHGLSDHLTYQLANEGYKIYKYVPFGRTEIMIPYLMRRAQETKKVLQSSSLQTKLLIDELKYRFYLK